ncbi:MAG TPA: G5 domain-containing protein [Candidatus Saccharimonadales bacterium]|nr:G5 domain-containing protein [Candidatus Saccharimonadales bacterium]
MSRTLAKWGALLGIVVIALAILIFPLRRGQSSEIFAAASTDPLHPVEKVVVQTSASSIPEALAAAGVAYYPEDRISVLPDPALGLGSFISITRALPLTIIDGKRKYVARTWATTVGDLVTEKNLELGQDDKISPPLNTALTTDMTITIVRVAKTNVIEKEIIPFQTIQQNDDTMWRGQTKVSQVGSNGERTKTYLVIREDGVQVSKTLTSNVVSTQVVNKIVLVGTKLKIGRTFSGKLTWYSASTKVAISSSTGLKKGQDIRVTNPSNGKSIIVTIDDYCPASAGCASIVDLSPTYFLQLQSNLYNDMPQVKVEEILN